MKRSEINNAIKWAEARFKEMKITLPPFANRAVDDWDKKEDEVIISTMMGWDVTDFGRGDFSKVGAVLFTVRNGDVYTPGKGVPYCEKYIVLKDGNCQEIPMHYHIDKTEDIINRGGGVLCVQVCGRTADDMPDMDSTTEVYMDGKKYTFSANDVIEVEPGASITLTPFMYHRFWAKTGAGDLIVGEVSKVNDDNNDNIFADRSERFSEIIEDEPKYRLLVNEY